MSWDIFQSTKNLPPEMVLGKVSLEAGRLIPGLLACVLIWLDLKWMAFEKNFPDRFFQTGISGSQYDWNGCWNGHSWKNPYTGTF